MFAKLTLVLFSTVNVLLHVSNLLFLSEPLKIINGQSREAWRYIYAMRECFFHCYIMIYILNK